MGEIGAGDGSSFPTTLDTNNTLEVNAPNAGKTLARADVPNDLAACIIKIETELGTDPAGHSSIADVKTFMQVEHGTDGTHTVDVIAEKTGNSGVTIDGCLVKDGMVSALAGPSTYTNAIKVLTGSVSWNMDLNTGAQVTATNNSLDRHVFMRSLILNNAGTTLYSHLYNYHIGTNPYEVNIYPTATYIITRRSQGNSFDDPAFNAATLKTVTMYFRP